MAMHGSLRDMAVADLIQHNCQDRKTAQLKIHHNGSQAVIFFKDGNVVHATLGNTQGEEVIYGIIGWEEGQFTLDAGIEPPAQTIHRSWSSLVLEGAKRLDEAEQTPTRVDQGENTERELKSMAPKMEEFLKELGEQVPGFIETSVFGSDGLGIAAHARSGKINIENINAQLALYTKLIDTSVTQLNAGTVEDILLETENAYLLVRFLEDRSTFLGLVADRKTASLGNMRLNSRLYADRISKAMLRR